MMTIETKAEFAKRNGWSRPYVSQLSRDGRLVLTPDGKKVCVEESLRRIEATRGRRFDTEEAIQRRKREKASADPAKTMRSEEMVPTSATQAGEAAATDNSQGQDGVLTEERITRRTRLAQMRKVEAEASKREVELAEARGKLIPRDGVLGAIRQTLVEVETALSGIPGRLAPQLAAGDELVLAQQVIEAEIADTRQRIAIALSRVAAGPVDEK